MQNIIFKAIVGSQSYGTSTPTSDVDYKGVYMQSIDELIGFGYVQQIDVTKDECYYEVRRFLQLLQSGNPTVLELLYSPSDCIVTSSPHFELIVANRDKFITKKCLKSFGGYAVDQINKARGLDKKMNYEKDKITRKDVLDFCYVMAEDGFKTIPIKTWLKKEGLKQQHVGLSKLDHFRDCYSVFYDHIADMKSDNPRFEGGGFGYRGIIGEDSNEVRTSNIPRYAIKETTLYFNREEYSMHCMDYKDYETWLENRNTQRFVDVKSHNQKIDGKNVLHCRRLLDMAMEIAATGTVQVKRPNADYLLSIRRGEVNLEEIISQAEKDILVVYEAYKNSSLPDEVDSVFVNDLLLEIRKL